MSGWNPYTAMSVDETPAVRSDRVTGLAFWIYPLAAVALVHTALRIAVDEVLTNVDLETGQVSYYLGSWRTFVLSACTVVSCGAAMTVWCSKLYPDKSRRRTITHTLLGLAVLSFLLTSLT